MELKVKNHVNLKTLAYIFKLTEDESFYFGNGFKISKQDRSIIKADNLTGYSSFEELEAYNQSINKLIKYKLVE